MSNLSASDKVFVEKLFQMETGYVLNFSDRAFSEFFADSFNVDIDEPRYAAAGTSKAKRLRSFFKHSDPPTVARALLALWEHREAIRIASGQEETIPEAGVRLVRIARQLTVDPAIATPVPGPLDLIRSKSAAEFATRDGGYRDGLRAIVAQATARRSSRSGGTMISLGRLAERELRERAQITLDAARRVVAGAKSLDSGDMVRRAAKDLVEAIVDASYASLSRELLQTPPFPEMRQSNPSAVLQIEYKLGTVRRSAIDQARAELDLLTFEVSGQHTDATAVENRRVLATVLFTDIVDSTPKAALAGDAEWRRKMTEHNSIARTLVGKFGGRLVKTTGDGVLATFGAPGFAIRCALAIVKSVSDLGLSIRAGLHTGEIEDDGADISGIAVNMAQRVMSMANENDVLISGVVASVIAGSDIRIEDRGEKQLKGFPQPVRIFSVVRDG